MPTLIQHHEIVAVLIARVFLGCLFFFQGYDAVFNIKIRNVIYTYQNTFASKGIPKFVTVLGSWFTSYSELICGFLLIIGLFKYYALYFLGMDVILASIAFGITTPMWDMRHYPHVGYAPRFSKNALDPFPAFCSNSMGPDLIRLYTF